MTPACYGQWTNVQYAENTCTTGLTFNLLQSRSFTNTQHVNDFSCFIFVMHRSGQAKLAHLTPELCR